MRIDPSILEGGELPPVWTEPHEGVRFKVRFARASERKEFRNSFDGEPDPEQLREFFIARVVDWDGVEDNDGNAIPFSRERLDGFLDVFDKFNFEGQIIGGAVAADRFLAGDEPRPSESAPPGGEEGG